MENNLKEGKSMELMNLTFFLYSYYSPKYCLFLYIQNMLYNDFYQKFVQNDKIFNLKFIMYNFIVKVDFKDRKLLYHSDLNSRSRQSLLQLPFEDDNFSNLK